MAKIMVLSIKIGMLYGRQGKIIFPLKWLEMALAQLRSFPAIFANIWIVPYFCILNFLHQNLECGDEPDKFCLGAFYKDKYALWKAGKNYFSPKRAGNGLGTAEVISSHYCQYLDCAIFLHFKFSSSKSRMW